MKTKKIVESSFKAGREPVVEPRGVLADLSDFLEVEGDLLSTGDRSAILALCKKIPLENRAVRDMLSEQPLLFMSIGRIHARSLRILKESERSCEQTEAEAADRSRHEMSNRGIKPTRDSVQERIAIDDTVQEMRRVRDRAISCHSLVSSLLETVRDRSRMLTQISANDRAEMTIDGQKD